MCWIAMIVAFILISLTGSPTAQAEKRVALVIGINDHAILPDLNNARKDAEGMAAKLKELGFDVILELNAGKRKLFHAVNEFVGRISTGAVDLVFFAGHGIQSGSINYLIPSDARIEVEADLRAEALDTTEILQSVERAGIPRNIKIRRRQKSVRRRVVDVYGLLQIAVVSGGRVFRRSNVQRRRGGVQEGDVYRQARRLRKRRVLGPPERR
jgi:hypothetical protein